MNLREAAQMALEALEYPGPSWVESRKPAAAALRAALAEHDRLEGKAKPITTAEMSAWVKDTWEKCQAEAWQEPVAWWNGKETVWLEHELMGTNPPIENAVPLYTASTPRNDINAELVEALTTCVCAMQDYQAGIGITDMFDKGERMGRAVLAKVGVSK